MLFTVTLDLALLLLALWLWERKPLRLYGFYVFLGLATLAKGPLAVVLAGLVFLGYAATFRDWGALRPLLLSPALAVYFAVAAPWYVLCYVVNGAPFVEDFILEHNLARFVSADALGHGQPAWFYIPVLVAGLFPWSPLLLLPLAEMVCAARGVFRDKQRAFLFWWIALPFLFFSLSENKLPGYLLPVLPPVTLWFAILVARAAKPSGDAESSGSSPGKARHPSGHRQLRLLGHEAERATHPDRLFGPAASRRAAVRSAVVPARWLRDCGRRSPNGASPAPGSRFSRARCLSPGGFS